MVNQKNTDGTAQFRRELYRRFKDIVDMPNEYADRIIRSIQQNKGNKSSKLVKEFEFLADEDTWLQMVHAVQIAFKD